MVVENMRTAHLCNNLMEGDMLTLQIQNPEVESFISSRYGADMQSLFQDFSTFVKVALSDGYPAITADEARARVAKALQEIDEGAATMLSQEAYDAEMQAFMKRL
jgi:5,10-methylenetetrahydrofolate reductase